MILSVFQLIVGIAAIAAYADSGEPLGKWTVTLILAAVFAIMGTVGIIDCIRTDKEK